VPPAQQHKTTELDRQGNQQHCQQQRQVGWGIGGREDSGEKHKRRTD
jgi:hypothetical protein